MTNVTYDERETRRLQPLLLSIGREIRERSIVLSLLVTTLDELASKRDEATIPDARRLLNAEAASQRRELLRARQELEGLGCSLLRRSPVTIHIPGTEDGEDRTVIWRLQEGSDQDEVEELRIPTHGPWL